MTDRRSEPVRDAEIPIQPEHPVHQRSKLRSWIAFIVGIALLIGAGYFVYTGTDGLEGVWESISSAPWWMILLVLLGPIGNHASVAMCLQALLSRHGTVGKREMFVLVGSAWLFNYLPMRPGLFGRMGYHKAINKIRLRDSFESSVWSGILAGIGNSILVVVALVMVKFSPNMFGSIVLFALPVVVLFALVPAMPGKRTRLLMRALAFRQIDVLVWLGRYWLAFTVLGLEMNLAEIAMISAVSQLASLFPLTGSGVGFREWGVGLAASVGGYTMGTAIAGDLINRTAETIIVVPVGLVCTALVARHWKGMNGARLPKHHAREDSEHEHEAGNNREQDPSVQRNL